MMKTIENLLQNSRLPGPRGNLTLLHSFAQNATTAEIDECLSLNQDTLQNCPEEFVVMCGIVGYCVVNRERLEEVFYKIRPYASHQSWRIREAVAIGIQEIAEIQLGAILRSLQKWLDGNELEQRAVVATLCEPKLLKIKAVNRQILDLLTRLTLTFSSSGRLTDSQIILRKALGYGWSVVISAIPDEEKAVFEAIARNENKHIRWIVTENLKKKRLIHMDAAWVEKMGLIIGC